MAAGWSIWAASWLAASVWRRRTIARPDRFAEAANLAVTALGATLLFATQASAADGGRQVLIRSDSPFEPIQLWATPAAAGWILAAIAATGFLVCWWARLHLGRLWSGTVTLKPGHRIVESGPYKLVRHPIYTGLIISASATAADKGTLLALAGLALIVVGLWMKARLEERFLRVQLGSDAYDIYASRTPMLAPFAATSVRALTTQSGERP